MTTQEWVVDTWVLARADPQYEESMEAVTLLCLILRNQRIALDHDGRIEDEYQSQIRRVEHVRIWWTRMVSTSGKISHRDGNLKARHRRELVEAGQIGDTDGVFVSVASNAAPTKYLVTEDGDYSAHVVSYLQSELAVNVLSLAAALQTIE